MRSALDPGSGPAPGRLPSFLDCACSYHPQSHIHTVAVAPIVTVLRVLSLLPQPNRSASGLPTTADTLATSVSLPYEWASESAEFGLEFVKGALEIGESLPMIGACFTLCLIIAKARREELGTRGGAKRKKELGACGRIADHMRSVAWVRWAFQLQPVC